MKNLHEESAVEVLSRVMAQIEAIQKVNKLLGQAASQSEGVDIGLGSALSLIERELEILKGYQQ